MGRIISMHGTDGECIPSQDFTANVDVKIILK